MKNSNTIVALLFSVVLLVTISCQSSSSEKVAESKAEVEEAEAEASEARAEYKADIEKYKMETNAQISANEQSIKDFKVVIANSKKEVKADYDQKILVLEQKNSEMKKKMEEYNEDGKEKWAQFKEEFSHDMDELGQALKDLTVNNTK